MFESQLHCEMYSFMDVNVRVNELQRIVLNIFIDIIISAWELLASSVDEAYPVNIMVAEL